MTPLELSEPLFQYVCRVNRSARKGGVYAEDQVRAEVRAILADIKAKADTDPDLAGQFDPRKGRLLLVLMFFVDFMVRNSSLSFAREWGDLAAEEGEPDGDRRFFQMMDETLADRSEAATQRLAVYYTCLGLGFSGSHTGEAKFLRQKMLELSARLRSLIGSDAATRVCPEAYENVNTDNLVQPPSSSLVGVAHRPGRDDRRPVRGQRLAVPQEQERPAGQRERHRPHGEGGSDERRVPAGSKYAREPTSVYRYSGRARGEAQSCPRGRGRKRDPHRTLSRSTGRGKEGRCPESRTLQGTAPASAY